MALDVTVGGTGSNSYADLSEMAAFVAETPNTDNWDALTTDAEREALLITAARTLNREAWRGTKTESTQALAFPRDGIVDRDGVAIADDVIPDEVKYAQMKLAIYMAGEDLLADTGLEDFEEAKVGPIEVKLRQRSAADLPSDVRREIAFLLKSSPMQFSILRG